MSRMNDDRRSQAGRSIREIISDATDRELEDFDTGSLSPDRLRAMAAAEERRRKRRIRRISGIAALFVLVLACGAFLVFSTFTADVEADKNPKEEIVTEDGVIIEDGGWGSSSEEGWVITDWNEVKNVKRKLPNLVVPEYIPSGCEFKSLTVIKLENIINIEYLYLNGDGTDIILHQYLHEENLEATQLYENDRKIECEKGVIYITDNPNDNTATMQLDDGCIVELMSTLNDNELIRVFNGLSH